MDVLAGQPCRDAFSCRRPMFDKKMGARLTERPPGDEDRKGGNGPRLFRIRLHVVSALAVVGQVETFLLLLVGRTHTDRELEDQHDNERYAARPEQRDADVPELRNDLSAGIELT